MSTEIRLPQWGMGMIEGRILQWYKQEGDAVEADEPLAEIEAAKTTEDVVAPQAGVLERILVPAGTMVPVHQLLATLAPVGGEKAGAQQAPSPRAVVTTPTAPATAPRPATAAGAATAGGTGHVVPKARKLARELGVDLATVTGTGPGGRILPDDVLAVVGPPVAGTPAAGPPVARTGTAEVPGEDGATIPLQGMRGTIAQRMHASLQAMAQLTLVTTADVTDLVTVRQGLDQEHRPTYTDFIVRAAALALCDHPHLNATLEGDTIQLHSGVHIGIATAVEDGLVVPVVRDADQKSLQALADESARLVDKVRAGDFSIEDVSGSTFTVTSLGGQHIDAFTPIINPPEVAILGIGRIVEQPVRAGDGLAWRNVITLSLTIDHRAVDGAPGAAFLETVAELLGRPQTLVG